MSGCAYDEDPRGPWGRAVTPAGARRCTVQVRWGEVAYPAVVDPAWTTTGSMAAGRYFHTASALGNGKVLVTGGNSGGSPPALSSAEIYDPSSGTWSSAASMATGHRVHTATVLGNGRVLVAGGNDGGTTVTAIAELYNPSNGTWTTTGSMATARAAHQAIMLGDGTGNAAGGSV